jgi:predicted LPLAT superfamily acyltransferase
MIKLYYKFITLFSKIFGYRFFAIFARFVSTGYFLLFPKRVATGVRFYRALFPERGRMHHLRCTWRQFHSFTNVFLDRFMLQHSGGLSYTSENWAVLEKEAAKGAGGIIVMSHVGNWDVAAHLLRKKGLNLMLYMGARQKEQVEKMQKAHLSESGLKVVSVDQNGGSPFDILEGLRFLKQGGLVSLAGDRTWSKNQRTVPVSFLGHRLLLPEAPHALAQASGAPLFIFFAFRKEKGKYAISISEPIRIKAPSRADRPGAVRESAQRYADILAQKARQYPFQWYHFEEFLGEKIES